MIPILKLSAQSRDLVAPVFPDHQKIMKAAQWRACEDVEAIVRRAEEHMRAIRLKMEEDLENERIKAIEQGYEDGLSQIIHELAKVRAERVAMLEQAETEALNLAFALAHRIVGKAVEIDPVLVKHIVAEVAQSARGRRSVVIRIHPEDLSIVASQQSELAQALEGAAVFFDDDPSLERGGCVIETEVGRIDGRLETQLTILRKALEKSR